MSSPSFLCLERNPGHCTRSSPQILQMMMVYTISHDSTIETGKNLRWKKLCRLSDGWKKASTMTLSTAAPLADMFSILSTLGSSVDSDKLTIVLNSANVVLFSIRKDIPIGECWYIFAVISMADGDLSCLGGTVAPGPNQNATSVSWLHRPETPRGMSLIRRPSGHPIQYGIRTTRLMLTIDLLILEKWEYRRAISEYQRSDYRVHIITTGQRYPIVNH